MALLRSITTVGGFTLISRVLGFVRDILIAAVLGTGWVADCFFVAFKLPNFFRRLFAEGAFSAAFVPLFAGRIRGPSATGAAPPAGLAEARRFAEQSLAVLLLVLLLFVSLFQIAMPWLMYGLAPGFAANPEKFDLAVTLTRITFPYLLFISLVSLLAGMLNAVGRFAAAASAPILLNLCLIGGLLVLARHTATAAHALAWSVAVAGVVQFLWLLAAARRAGLAPRLPRPRLSPGVRELIRLMIPGIIGAGAVQINLVIDVVLASFLPSGSLSYLFYADRLNQLPIGVVGVAIGTALLPALSRQLAAGDEATAAQSQNRASEYALLLTVPAALALMVAGGPIIQVLFERGAFTPASAVATGQALMAYAAGLPAYVLIKVLAPGFFARKDMKTPVRYALIALAVNTVLNIILMIPLKHAGLALATAIAAWLNAGLLAGALMRRGHFRIDARLRRRLPGIVAAAALMAVVLWLLGGLLGPWFAGDGVARIGGLAVLVGAGAVSYFAAAWLFGALGPGDLKALLRRRPRAGG